MPYAGSYFPFRRNNRKPNGTWDAPDATDENIKGTSVDPHEPLWPRWKQTPPPHGEGEFVSEEPFFDIDEISQRAEFYPPGRTLVDKNVDGNPARRQRGSDLDAGNSWRRRLLVGPRNGLTDVVNARLFAQAPTAPNSDASRTPDPQSTQSDVMQSTKPMDITGRTSGRVIGRWYGLGTPSEKVAFLSSRSMT